MTIPTILWLALTPPLTPEAAREAVRRADVEMCRAVSEHDAAGFRAFIAEDAAFYAGSGAVMKGPGAVVAGWAPLLARDRSSSLTWEPDTVEVAGSGELAYSSGPFLLTTRDASGATRTLRGRYVTIWRRGQDGRFRVIVDIGTRPTSD
jgi:ketosteroid isomerase-like protein